MHVRCGRFGLIQRPVDTPYVRRPDVRVNRDQLGIYSRSIGDIQEIGKQCIGEYVYIYIYMYLNICVYMYIYNYIDTIDVLPLAREV